jgi:hypothetical protein
MVTDPDLGAVMDAWPELPEAIKASSVARVKLRAVVIDAFEIPGLG